MDNARIFKAGVLSSTVAVGEQGTFGSDYSTFTYDKVTNTIKANSNFQVIGDLTQINTVNSTYFDNVLTLNVPANTVIPPDTNGTGISAYRVGSYATFKFIEAQMAWVASLADGTNIKIKTTNVPTAADDLTNKLYVDTQIANLTANLTLANLGDVQFTSLTSGQMIQWNGTKWVNVPRPPDGVTSATITATGGLISKRRKNDGSYETNTTSSNPPYTDYTSTILKAETYQEFQLDLVNQSVTPGAYKNSNITVNQKGIITSVSSNNLFQSFRLTSSAGGSSNGPITMLPIAPDDFLIVDAGNGIDVLGYDPDSGPGCAIRWSLKNTGVIAGSYPNANITVDSTGRITSASSGGVNGWSSINPDVGGVLNAPGVGQQLRFEGAGSLQTYNNGGGSIGVTMSRNVVAPGTYNCATVTVDDTGRVVGINANNAMKSLNTTNGNAFTDVGGGISVFGGAGGISTRVTGNVLYIDNPGGFQSVALTGNGFSQFANGLMFQWGTVYTPRNSNGAGSFPVAFPNQCFSAVMNGVGETGQFGGQGGDPTIYTFNNATFFWHSGDDNGCNAFYIAVGF